jgi:hypothetical protein
MVAVTLLTVVKVGLSGDVVVRPITLREPRIDARTRRYGVADMSLRLVVVAPRSWPGMCAITIRRLRTTGQMV